MATVILQPRPISESLPDSDANLALQSVQSFNSTCDRVKSMYCKADRDSGCIRLQVL